MMKEEEIKEKLEKIEIEKNNLTYFYTGVFLDGEDGWVTVKTIKGEVYKFRKEQIVQRLLNPECLQKQFKPIDEFH
jgi:hypothetical protein